MKKLLTLLVAGMPATALAHPGHAELSGPMGHDIAHVVIGVGFAAVVAIVGVAVRKGVHRRED